MNTIFIIVFYLIVGIILLVLIFKTDCTISCSDLLSDDFDFEKRDISEHIKK